VDCGDHLGIWKIVTVIFVVVVVGTVIGISVVDVTVAITVGCAWVIFGMVNHCAAVSIVAIVGVVFVVAAFIVVVVVGHADAYDRVVVVGVFAILINTLIVSTVGVVAVWVVTVLGIVTVRFAVGIRGLVVGAEFFGRQVHVGFEQRLHCRWCCHCYFFRAEGLLCW